LEIIDREGLAEQLADPEIFWIAARYLDIPLEIFPDPAQANSEYERLRAKWFVEDANPQRYADFIEVKRAARHALGDVPQDLSRWIQLLVKCEVNRSGAADRRQVSYEIIVLTIRQTRSLRGQEERIRGFLRELGAPQYPDLAVDAEAVHSYASTAFHLDEAALAKEELDSWHETISCAADAGIAVSTSANQLCQWLRLRGEINLNERIRLGEPKDLSDVLQPWLRLTDELHRAPLFPVQDFHDQLLLTEKLLGNHSILDETIKQLRPIMAERTGAGVVADSHFQRADQFLQKKQILRALRELHEARIKWFSQQTLGRSVLCCLQLGRCYEQLQLNFAAIYYEQVATFLAINSEDDSIRGYADKALLDAAHSAYSQGHWCLFFELAGPALASHYHLASEAFDLDQEPQLRSFVQNVTLCLTAVRRLVPGIFDVLMSEIRSWSLEELVRDLMAATVTLTTSSEERFEAVLHNSFTGPPFADAGARCEVMWSAHGIRWRMRWENRYEALRVMGEVVAFFQIALAELAGCDLDVVPGTLVADFELTEDSAMTAQAIPDNDVYRWLIRVPRRPLPGQAGVDGFRSQVLECFVRIVRSISLISSKQFEEILVHEMGPRLFRHDFFARRFPELIDLFPGQERFGFLGRTTFACPLDLSKWEPKSAPELIWTNSIHPRFDEAAELENVRRRYDVGLAGLRYTIPRVKEHPEFRATIQELRRRGWKDWHILSAMLSAAANYRVRMRRGDEAPLQVFRQAVRKEIFTPETVDSPTIPISIFKAQTLEMYSLILLQSSLSKHGFELYQSTPNRTGLAEYARHRWRYWDLDVPHEDIFAAN
jgi:hypothetical protein